LIFVIVLLGMIFTLGGINTGTVVGVGIGGIGGFVLGAIAGGFLGFLGGILIGALFGFLGAFLGGLLGALLQDLFDAIFGGDSGGQLNLESSPDHGLTFANKNSFERSREQMALALSGDRLYIAWTGNDAQVNTLAVSNSFPQRHPAKASFEQSNHCGPAIAWDDSAGSLWVVWVGTEGHLNIRSVTVEIPAGGGDATFFLRPKKTLSAKSPADATPGLVAANGFLYLAFVNDPGGTIRIWRSADHANTWDEPLPIFAATPYQGTAALAFGDGRLYLVWIGFGADSPVLLKSFAQDPADGSLSAPHDGAVAIGGVVAAGNPATGPAVAYGNGELFVAWTDSTHAMHVAVSSDQGGSFSRETLLNPETSRGNAGPAITFESAAGLGPSTLLYGWTGQG
jgi:hypothetical protein